MTASETKKRVNQLGLTDAGRRHFKVFRSFDFRNEQQVKIAAQRFKGFALVVIDSWTAAHNLSRRRDSNAEVASLDDEVFLPLVEQTGATLFILDNTGHDWWNKGERVKADHARGASAKGDKMDYSLFFSRPDEHDNFTTEIEVKKVRIDYPTPPSIVVSTPRDRIEFYEKLGDGFRGYPLWPASRVDLGGRGDDPGGDRSLTGDEPFDSVDKRPGLPNNIPSAGSSGPTGDGGEGVGAGVWQPDPASGAPPPPAALTETPAEAFARQMREARAQKYLEEQI